jgi:ABC-type lipoprotein export system ATPase subunit
MSDENKKLMIECENLVKIYKTKDIEVVALQGLDLIVEEGELTAIIGNSGSGKSTLLNMLGGLDRPSAGKLNVAGEDLLKFNDNQLMVYKRDTIGFVWQNNARNLIPYLSALQNIEIPLILSGFRWRRERALEILEMVGLLNRKNNKLGQLSGGEQQRVAIGIALANNPRILLADEPTGSVDSKTAGMILDIFRELNKELGLTIIIVTHDQHLSKKVDRVVAIRDGRTSSEFIRKKSYQEELEEMGKGIDRDLEKETHVELAVLDKVGRMQIPGEYLEALGLKGRDKIRVELAGDRIVLLAPAKIENDKVG